MIKNQLLNPVGLFVSDVRGEGVHWKITYE